MKRVAENEENWIQEEDLQPYLIEMAKRTNPQSIPQILQFDESLIFQFQKRIQ